MKSINTINPLDISWILLIFITSANVLGAETAELSLAITALICS